MDNTPPTREDFYAGWTKARFDLLRASVGRVFVLLSASRVDDEAWRAAVAGETFLWRAVREAGAPAVPPRFATVHRRGGDMLDLPTGAGDSRSESVERRDPDLFGRSMRRLDDAERSARAVFASAFQLTDTRSGANR